MTIAIIDYGSGNLCSAAKAFERAVAEAGRKESVVLTDSPGVVAAASHVVLPGVGAFADCKRGLHALPGMIEALTRAVKEDARPFLGICVGMQLMATWGREHGDEAGLGWIPGEVVALAPNHPAPGDPPLKIPHMGWNDFTEVMDHPVLKGIGPGRHAYFVHSYGFVAENPADALAVVDYGGPVTAVVGRGTMIGTQFHPEKSQAMGLRLITNFVKWRP